MTDLQFERGLPSSIDTERSLLGAVLLDNHHYYAIAERLTYDDFALESHRRIFRRMGELLELGSAIDYITMRDILARHKEIDSVGGVAYLSSLTENMPRRVSVKEYVGIVAEKAALRRVVEEGTRAVSEAVDQSGSADEVLSKAEESFREIRARFATDSLVQAGAISGSMYEHEDAIFDNTAMEIGVPTGMRELDEMTCGFQRGEMIIVGARPSMGKTACAGNIAEHAAVHLKRTTAFFSLEMKARPLLERMYCSLAEVSFEKLRKGWASEREQAYIKNARNMIDASPLYVDETPRLNASAIRARCQGLKQREGLDLVIIDYIGLMGSEAGAKEYKNRQHEVGVTSRALKAMAKDLDVPVVVLSQLNRGNEARTDKRPVLSDLRESGDIEQDADLVLFLHRESYYSRDDESLKGKGEVIIAKQRNGPTGTVHLKYSDHLLRWSDL